MKTIRTHSSGIFIVLLTLIALILFTTSIKAAGPQAAAKPIVIGTAQSIKFDFGLGGVRAATLAVEEINRAGGVNVAGVKHPLQLEVADCRSMEPGHAVNESLLVVEKLILDKKVDLFSSGPTNSEAALACMDLIAKYKKIFLFSCGPLTPVLHNRIAKNYDRYKYIFRSTGDVSWLGKENAQLYDEIRVKYGLNKLYYIIVDLEFARAGAEREAKTLQERGWTVLNIDRVPPGSTDFSSPLLKMKDTGAQVMGIWWAGQESVTLAKQWYDLKIPVLPYGSFNNAIEPAEAWKELGGKCEHWISNHANAGIPYAEFNPWVKKWWNGYKKRWGKEPEMYNVPTSYTGIYILKDAIERAGTYTDTDKLITALEKTDMKGTPQGRIRFDPQSHQVIPSLDPEEGAVGSISQWQEGKRVVIFPEKIAMGKMKFPPWMTR